MQKELTLGGWGLLVAYWSRTMIATNVFNWNLKCFAKNIHKIPPYFFEDKCQQSLVRSRFKFPSRSLSKPDIEVNKQEQYIAADFRIWN